MSVDAMKAGKYAASEVPCAVTLEECWDLVNTSESTGIPCMMLENWSFRRDNLAVLNMIRQGLFGEIVHCHCAHSHNCIDHWYWDTAGNPRWPAKYLEKYNRDQYPTHSLGPVLSWMDINCGDAFAYLTATASASLGINAHFTRLLGKDHEKAKAAYAQGDIVTSVIKTHRGRTLVVNNDMQLPRPYDNRWIIQGTLGLYDEARNSVYIHGKSPQVNAWEPFGPYQDKHDHQWWKSMAGQDSAGGHGGVDYLELRLFVDAVRDKTQPPIDVYDSVTMSVIIALSEESIAKGSAPVACPDFTRGQWKTRKPRFAVEA
jgi:predicted dehydrogenase